LREINDADHQMQFDRIKAEYFQRVAELRTRFEEETLRVAQASRPIVNARSAGCWERTT
jgi:hypothetical protein